MGFWSQRPPLWWRLLLVHNSNGFRSSILLLQFAIRDSDVIQFSTAPLSSCRTRETERHNGLRGAASTLPLLSKSIENRYPTPRPMKARVAATLSVRLSPACAAPAPSRTEPSAMPPCPTMIIRAFKRPRTHAGVTRCPANQNSDAAIAQATPAMANVIIRAGGLRTSASARRTTAAIPIAIEVMTFGEVRFLRYGRTRIAPANEPTATHVKKRPS